jgi:hypothetical protein
MATEPTDEELLERRHKALAKEREDLLAKRAGIDQELSQLDIRIQAWANYKATLEGKFRPPTAAAPRERKPRTPSTRAPRGERAKLRKKLADHIGQSPDGATAQALYQELGANTPHEKRPIDAALNAMKKDGTLNQERRHSPYKFAKGALDAHAQPGL